MSAQLYVVNPALPQTLQDDIRERDATRDDAKLWRARAQRARERGDDRERQRLLALAQLCSQHQDELTTVIREAARQL